MPIFLVEIQDNITASTLRKTLSNWSKGKVYVTTHRNENENGHSYVEEPKSLLSKFPVPFDNINNVTSPTALADTFGSDHVRIKEDVDENVDESEKSDIDRYYKKYEPPKEPNACSVGGA